MAEFSLTLSRFFWLIRTESSTDVVQSTK